MEDVLLVTCSDWPDGEPEGQLLVAELSALGIGSRWVAWDEPDVGWSEARLVAVRSPWDYEWRREEFLAWAGSVGPSLLNGAETFAWNTDKRYLVDLPAAGVPVVPTIAVEDARGVAQALARWFPAVVKPRVGAGGRGVVVLDGEPGVPPSLDESRLGPGPWVVQPLLGSVRTAGEVSVYVLGGIPVSQVRKLPAAGEIRVHEEYGGSTARVPLAADAADLARRAMAGVEGLLGRRLDYGRVDLMREDDGRLVVGEVEVTEPGLYLDVVPANAAAFARLVADVLRRSGLER